MAFKPISLDNYVQIHLSNNPSENEVDLRNKLKDSLAYYEKRIKCLCGNDIWVVGSAAVGNSCFTCITGESEPDGDYEIDSAIFKRENRNGRRHIDDMDPTKIAGFFDDDGYEVIRTAKEKPSLCLSCKLDANKDSFCDMIRYDLEREDVFKCPVFEKKL